MNRTIWIVHQYASTPETGMGGRHFYLARELAKKGYKVYLIASASHHLLREKPNFEEQFKVEAIDGFNFVWVNMPDYAEAHNKKRVINWFLFPWLIQKLARLIDDKPDVVLSSSPSPVAFLGAQRLAKKYKARLVFEVRDIWPMTLTEVGGYSRSHPFIRFLQYIEDKAYRDSDFVISNLKNAVEHMAARGMERTKFHWIPNGFSFDEVSKNVPLNNFTKNQLPQNKFIIGYTGTLGFANALDTLIESAERLKEYPEIAFVLVGEGKEKATLQSMVIDKGLTNVSFISSIPKEEIQAMLSHFDACFIGWLNDNLYQFGIGANKIPEYLYSGKPVLHAYSGSCDPILEYNSGISVPAQNPSLLSEAILTLYKMPAEERRTLGINGRRAAKQQYEYGKLADKLEKVLFQ
ncbi:glycosyltransferase family 4 protein [Photobacterium sp. TLY01]|uniref:glycosyltransferase family 4 protein n=1 Tax=Photobacterium sp. TLY01 TaxID=2907534 RepID=UPI001F3DC72C|nr:glycosyltransferase family 4 protein [Photobacterium sp. TLY01]UIP27223.1 glycosyltransferase family 4 protein [Photobacterium sp. TLY01]